MHAATAQYRRAGLATGFVVPNLFLTVVVQEQDPMALATYAAATPGTQPDFRCGFDIELAHAILQRMADGESLAAICRTAGMPTATTVYRWAARYEDFDEAFVLIRKIARQNRAWRTAQDRAARALARKGVKNPKITGRPSRFSSQMAEAICKRLMRG